jgi:uncharacterized membrane protein
MFWWGGGRGRVPAKNKLLVRRGIDLTAILLAITTAVGWGAADYFGGDASRRETPVFLIVAITELLGLVPVVAILIARSSPPPDNPRLLLAALSGVAVTVELGLIYRALAQGNAFITAPIGALGSAAAVTLGLIGGDSLDSPSALGWRALCSAVQSQHRHRRQQHARPTPAPCAIPRLSALVQQPQSPSCSRRFTLQAESTPIGQLPLSTQAPRSRPH